MAGVTSVNFGAPGDMLVSPPGVPLVTDASGNVLMAKAPVDVTPIALSSAALVAPVPLTVPVQVAPDCVPGKVCGGGSDSDSRDPAPEWPDEVPDPTLPLN